MEEDECDDRGDADDHCGNDDGDNNKNTIVKMVMIYMVMINMMMVMMRMMVIIKVKCYDDDNLTVIMIVTTWKRR